MRPLKDKDMRIYLNKAQEKMEVETVFASTTSEAELRRKIRKRRIELEGSIPIVVVSLQAVRSSRVSSEPVNVKAVSTEENERVNASR